MGTAIIVLILIVIFFFAIRSSLKHFKGEGGCCGGGGTVAEKKELSGPKIAEKNLHIEGMHCNNCKTSVERNINQIDGAVAKVNLKKNLAVVSMERLVDDEELKTAVEKAGFTITRIESR